jgi:hypothetical protein
MPWPTASARRSGLRLMFSAPARRRPALADLTRTSPASSARTRSGWPARRPTNCGEQIMRAFDAGWGGAVWKTIGEPIVNVSSLTPRWTGPGSG